MSSSGSRFAGSDEMDTGAPLSTSDPSPLVGFVVEILTCDGGMVDLVVDEVTDSELRGHLWSSDADAGTGPCRVVHLDDVVRVREWL